MNLQNFPLKIFGFIRYFFGIEKKPPCARQGGCQKIFISDFTDYLGGDSGGDAARRDGFRYYGARPDNGAVADGYTRKNGYVGAYPHLAAYRNGAADHVAARLRIFVVIDGADSAVMPYQAVVADGNAAPILKGAAHIYKGAFAYRGAFPAVGIEGREEPEAAVERLAGKLLHKSA